MKLLGAFSCLLLVAGCSDPSARWETGGIYSVGGGDGTFAVVKILAVDPGAVSIRLYRESFDSRPKNVAAYELSLGSLDDEDDEAGFGVGHLPLDYREFALWFPVLIRTEAVEEDELEGYRIWKENGGGVFSFEALEEYEEEGASR